MDAPPPAQAISRDDAINMLAQMDQMRARLFAFHPDLNLNRQQSMDYSFLPGSVDTSADPQAEAGTPSGTNPRALSSDSSVKFSVAPKAVLPIAEQPGLFHEIPQEEAATSASPSYRATVAVTTVMVQLISLISSNTRVSLLLLAVLVLEPSHRVCLLPGGNSEAGKNSARGRS